MLCEYGCTQEAKYQLKNGKWCCSKSWNSCEEVRRIRSERMKGKNIGQIPWNRGLKNCHSEDAIEKMSKANKGKIVSNETREKISKANKGKVLSENTRKKIGLKHKGKIISKETRDKLSKSLKGRKFSKSTILKFKLTISKIKERYPTFSKIEELRYNSNKSEEKEIQVHCKNHKCENSKEHDGWFTPSGIQLAERIRNIEKEYGNGGSYFYCSDKCKNECPLYGKRVSQLIKEDQLKAGVIKEEYYTEYEYQTYREEVLERSNYKCEYCGDKAEHVHHIKPQKLEPFFSLDPDYGIACCKNCHYEKGHKDECSTGQLSHTICI